MNGQAAVPPELRVVWDDGADRDLGLPAYATPGAAGADLRANLPADLRLTGLLLAPMARAVVPTGLRIEIPAGYEAQIRPRSGLAFRHGVTIANSPGTIDSDYRGPLGVLVVNLGAGPYVIAHGERIAQMIVAPVVQVRFAVVPVLADSARGAGGFGSTGKS